MTSSEIATIRLQTQQIAGTKFKTAKEIVSWMGAMQAQDYAMAKWAIGTRLPGSTEQMIETAIEKADIIRTHLLRPTWHFVSSDDIYWMLELTAPRIRSALRSWNTGLELSEPIFSKSNKIIRKALSGGNQLTREELMSRLEKAKILTNNNRSSHLMLRAELDGIVCSGPTKAKKQTYALLDERVPKAKQLSKEEALAKLASRYFSSHGPATLRDFAWWSGLLVEDAKRAMEAVKHDLIPVKTSSETYWLSNSFSAMKRDETSVHLLPAYDEFLISYKDRSASVPLEKQHRAFSNNGLFRPVIITNGQVTGSWKRTIGKDRVDVEAEHFEPPSKTNKDLTRKTAEKYGRFLDKKIVYA